MNKDINRIKVVLANSCQPTLETLMKIASLLEVSLNDLVRFEASPDIEKKKKDGKES